MSTAILPDMHLTVDDVMLRWPQTIRVFIDFRMRCVGCPIASFHSIEEACAEHGVDRDAFLEALREAANSSPLPPAGEVGSHRKLRSG